MEPESVAYVRELRERAKRVIVDDTLDVLRRITDSDGNSFDSEDIGPSERIARFIDLSTPDPVAGQSVMDVLWVIAPHWAEQFQREYLRDVENSPMFRARSAG